MPINPYLLNQAAKGTPSPLSSFLPAFQQAQDRKMKQDLLQEERGMRLAKMKQDWTEYVQKQKDRQKTSDREAAIKEIMAGDGTYEEKQAKLAERGFLDEANDVGGLIPDEDGLTWQDFGGRKALVDTQGNIVKWVQKTPQPSSSSGTKDVYENGVYVGSFNENEVPAKYYGNPNVRITDSAKAQGSQTDIGLEQPGNRDHSRRSISSMESSLELIDAAMSEIDSSDTNTGVLGWSKRNVIDPLVQLADFALPEGTGQWLYEAADVGGATRVETVANFLSGQLLPAITGETSGRFTEAERAMAQRTIALLETTKSSRSVRQALGDVKSILEASIRRQKELLGKGNVSGSAMQGPAIGSVEDGYEFIGGDPSDMSNWKRVGAE